MLIDEIARRLGIGPRRTPVKYASIGGSATWAMRWPEDLQEPDMRVLASVSGVDTPWGPSRGFRLVEIAGVPILRFAIHGWQLGPGEFPSVLDSLRVFWVLNTLGVQEVIVDGSVGGISAHQWDMMVVSDFVDLHSMPAVTEFGNRLGLRSWRRAAQPYCPRIRTALLIAAAQVQAEESPTELREAQLIDGGVYVCTPIGLFETATQISWYRRWGGDLVGQSGGQEALLARLCNMCVGAIYVVANDAEGLSQEWAKTPMKQFYAECARPMGRVVSRAMRRLVSEVRSCACAEIGEPAALDGLPIEGA